MLFTPDYRHFNDVMANRRPGRLPIYEHLINIPVIEAILGAELSGLLTEGDSDIDEFFKLYCRFFKKLTYDVVSYEVCITEVLPEGGAIR